MIYRLGFSYRLVFAIVALFVISIGVRAEFDTKENLTENTNPKTHKLF